jgi:hypothetical protein
VASTPSSTVAPAAAAAPTHLPFTGAGGPPVSSISIMVLLLLSALALVAGAVTALLGRQDQLEDDGITVEQ